jgi:release factor glutamine methyltransferase
MGAAPRRVLDIGTGSGAVAVMIDRLCANAQVTAVDISEGALSVAQGNASALGARVRFLKSDLFSALEGERFDGIVSNPPYIRTREIGALQREVQREPLLALDGGEDGLDFYRAIVGGARAHLLPGGKIFLEVGYDQAQEVGALLRAQGFTGIGMQKDWSGIDRVVYAQMGME